MIKQALSLLAAAFTAANMLLPASAALSPETESFIIESMEKDKAPGLSMVIVDDDDTEYHSFGYANIGNGTKADEYTIYELGSTTKAFTALAALILEDEGVIDLDADIREYVPWLTLTHDGAPAAITCSQLMSHTAGIPDKYYPDAIEGDDHDIMRRTAELINGKELDFAPGERFSYSNLGYDLLGYIIDLKCGTTYEDFVTERILRPLGMEHSGFHLETAQGYRLCFTFNTEYDAPRYQGSLPDGYLETCAADMALWLKAQMGIGENVPEQLGRLIIRSHSFTDAVCSDEDDEDTQYYSCGWMVSSGRLTHSGGNPNFTSDIDIFPEEKRAVCAMSNSSAYAPILAVVAVSRTWHGKALPQAEGATLPTDIILSAAALIIAVLTIFTVVGLFSMKKRLSGRTSSNIKKNIRLAAGIIISLIFIAADPLLILMSGYSVPGAFNSLWVWMPVSATVLALELPIFGILLLISSVRRRTLLE
ncbi:MAG: serine hydrolase [Oscillospiraceae bacterium]|nr:serine hydrolase [Oscillospiraceae bacterium]